MRVWIVAAILAAAGAAGAQNVPESSTPASAPSPSTALRWVISKPDWVRRPPPEEFTRFQPKTNGAYINGSARIECGVTAEGRLSDCIALDESPPGEGLGAAATKISQYFQMKPRDLDGRQVAGGIFSIRIQFRPDDLPVLAQQPTQDEIEAVWPAKAQGVAGSVMLECALVDGHPFMCTVHDETPPQMGFGAAALKLESKYWFTATDLDSLRRGGRRVNIPVKFEPRQAGLASFSDRWSAMTSAPWQTAPLSVDLAAAWPRTAPADLKEAKVRLRCQLTPEGGLAACAIHTEEPAGLGFSEAALALAAHFRVRLGAVDPDQLKNARVFVPITFENPALGRQSPLTLDKPNWVAFIDPQKMTDLYPAKALDAGVKTGRGVVVCTAAASGALTLCKIESEDPPGMDFGPAAVAAMAYFAVNPWTEDGHPVDGAKLHVPVRFNEPESPAVPAKPGG